LKKGKAVGSEKGKGLGCGLFYEQRLELILISTLDELR
jgi:hypothetical protein